MAEILGLKMEDGLAVEEDLLIEILVNLPIKSLIRFACVSKYWYALIKSRSFVTTHLKRRCNEGNECVLLKRKLPLPPEGTDESQGGSGAEVLSFHDPDSLELLVSPNLSLPPFLDHFVGDVFFDYMATCNGLLCLASYKIVILCNPALREFELLPPSPFCCPEGYVAYSSATAFGWDANTDAYKVVQLWLIVDSQKDYPEVFEDAWVRIDLFNSSTNSWRLIDAVVPWVLDDSRCNLFFHGACHWYSRSHSILSLDLSTEVFQHFEYPFSEDEKVETLGVLNQCLSLVCSGGWADYNFECPHFSIHIWVMKEYGVKESWTKDFVIKPYTFNYPILLLKDEWLLVVTDDYQLASCALRSSEVKRFHLDGKDGSMRALNFKESLISLKQVLHGRTQ